jgi:spore maturation protein CgeB
MVETPENPHSVLPPVVIARKGQSPFNRSIWQGFVRGFERLGYPVFQVEAGQIPDPSIFPERPCLFFSVHGGNVAPEAVLRYRNSGVPTAVYLLDEPYEVDRSTLWARLYDWVFSVDRATLPVHSQYSRAEYLPLGYDDEVFSPDGPRVESNILVLGSCYSVRSDLLAPLVEKWGDSVTWVGPGWKALCTEGVHVESYVTPLECAQYYRGANIVLNIHRDSYWSHFGNLNTRRIVATHLNPRFWEAAACRTCQLTTSRDDLRLYAPDTPTFDTADELDQQLQSITADEQARNRCATCLLEGVSDGSYYHRARHIAQRLALGT